MTGGAGSAVSAGRTVVTLRSLGWVGHSLVLHGGAPGWFGGVSVSHYSALRLNDAETTVRASRRTTDPGCQPATAPQPPRTPTATGADRPPGPPASDPSAPRVGVLRAVRPGRFRCRPAVAGRARAQPRLLPVPEATSGDVLTLVRWSRCCPVPPVVLLAGGGARLAGRRVRPVAHTVVVGLLAGRAGPGGQAGDAAAGRTAAGGGGAGRGGWGGGAPAWVPAGRVAALPRPAPGLSSGCSCSPRRPRRWRSRARRPAGAGRSGLATRSS